MGDYLAKIIAEKKREIAKLPEPLTFGDALKKNHLAVIAEIKRKSPSKGELNLILDPVEQAKRYVKGGASAISVLTDQKYFGGNLDDLRRVVEACPGTPVLRKDFIVDIKQLYETARTGAQAVLLIANVLKSDLPIYIYKAKELGLETLTEVHTLEELQLAQHSGAEVIGVNNRNLTTFEVHLSTAELLAAHFKPSIIKVAESGIKTAQDAAFMRSLKFDAVLIGEALVKADNPEDLIEEFCHVR